MASEKAPDRIAIRIDDDFVTTTVDVARVWVKPEGENSMSVAVIVRAVSEGSKVHEGLLAELCKRCRAAVEDFAAQKKVELWTRVSKAAEGGQPEVPRGC